MTIYALKNDTPRFPSAEDIVSVGLNLAPVMVAAAHNMAFGYYTDSTNQGSVPNQINPGIFVILKRGPPVASVQNPLSISPEVDPLMVLISSLDAILGDAQREKVMPPRRVATNDDRDLRLTSYSTEPAAQAEPQARNIEEARSAALGTDEPQEFDLKKYKEAIMQRESGGSYSARNDNKGKDKNVDPNKWAFGKYQFIAPTANQYGAHIDPTDEASIQRFLRDHKLQEQVMDRFTMANYKKYMSQSPETKETLARNGYSVDQVIAAMHFSGPRSINWAEGTIKKGKDWLGTSTDQYIAKL